MDAENERPARKLSYRLEHADLVACEFQTAKLDLPMKAVLTIIVGVGGLIVAALPETMSRFLWWGITLAILAVAALAALVFPTWAIRRRAGRLKTPQGDTVVEDRGSHIVETTADDSRTLRLDEIADVLFGPDHLFLMTSARPIILPVAAFVDLDDMNYYGLQLSRDAKQARQPAAELAKA